MHTQVTRFQREQGRSFYNEFVLDPKHWVRHLPDAIEAYFVMDDEHNVYIVAYAIYMRTLPPYACIPSYISYIAPTYPT